MSSKIYTGYGRYSRERSRGTYCIIYKLYPINMPSCTLQHHAAQILFLVGHESASTPSLCIENSKSHFLCLDSGMRREGEMLGGKAVGNRAGAAEQ